MEKREDLIALAKYFQEYRRIILWNINHDQSRLLERDKLARQRGIIEPIVIPEGYWDEDKHLKESITIMQEKLKECDEILQNIHRSILIN